MHEKAEVAQLKEQEDVKTALKQTAGTKETIPAPAPELRDRLWFGTYILVLLVLFAFYYVLGSNRVPAEFEYIPTLRSVLLGAIFIVLAVAIAKSIRVYLISQVDNKAARFNLTRVLNLVTFLAIIIIGLSVLSANWYTALVSLGVLSLILGFALQTPITSLIGWVYLLIRQPYKVGDRIQIGDAKGDVIDVSYLDTTLWEFGGPYLSTEHPSGRIIKFPNSLALNETVYNYSWPLFPYVWNEIKFQVGYESDLEFLAQTMQRVVEEELGEQMTQLVPLYRELLLQTPVDELEIRERPVVHFRASENTWLEAIVRYLVHPKEAGRIKTRIIKQLLDQLNAEPERVLFPKSNLR
ncbi:MAG TPA: mechanosensitive ion channel family protein [Anaerolineales bacterium]|nr:mechanosensitive ion channel family protein [Anaerolineales bacterium]